MTSGCCGAASAGALLYVAGSFGVSAGAVAGNILKASFQQRYCPPALLGRLIASSSFVNYGTLPLGALLGGALGSALGLRPAMWIMTAGVPLAALILLFSPVGTVRDLPTRPTGVERREPGEGGPDPERRGGPDPEQSDGPGPGAEGRDGAPARP